MSASVFSFFAGEASGKNLGIVEDEAIAGVHVLRKIGERAVLNGFGGPMNHHEFRRVSRFHRMGRNVELIELVTEIG